MWYNYYFSVAWKKQNFHKYILQVLYQLFFQEVKKKKEKKLDLEDTQTHSNEVNIPFIGLTDLGIAIFNRQKKRGTMHPVTG